MRLLNARTVRLAYFDEINLPPYVILSHTWGDDEVSFQEIHSPDAASKAGYAKINYVCQEALRRGIEFVWVDTCCIDKTSSAELSEAINSMYRWYNYAEFCYVYLADVPSGTDLAAPESDFVHSRWFSRGWTLQELLVPTVLHFFSSDGQQMGSRKELSKQISTITGIGESFLDGKSPLAEASVSQRMSWASCRKTTRIEDLAYCLLGVFEINMPLLYGEGDNAFLRLQEEIMKKSDDQTLFAWGYDEHQFIETEKYACHGPLAREPAAFKGSGAFIPDELSESRPYGMTNRGLQIDLPIIRLPDSGFLAVLAARPEGKFLSLVAIPVDLHNGVNITRSLRNCVIIARDDASYTPSRPMYFLTNRNTQIQTRTPAAERLTYLIRRLPAYESGLSILDVEPRDAWDPKQRLIQCHQQKVTVLRLWRGEEDTYAVVFLQRSLEDIFSGKLHFLDRKKPDPHHKSVLVFKETTNIRPDYTWLSVSNFIPTQFKQRMTSDIRATIGGRIRMSTGIVINPVDITVETNQAAPKAAPGPQHLWSSVFPPEV